MKYCIVYTQPNLFSEEKISVGIICLTGTGWKYRYSERKVSASLLLLDEKTGRYVEQSVRNFQKDYIDNRSDASVLSSLETLHRYSNNYIVFSQVKEIDLPESLMSPDRLYDELVGNKIGL